MINDLTTDSPTVKYVDDTTIYRVTNSVGDKTLQLSVDTAINWSGENSMRINGSKTKEMVICYSKNPPLVPHIQVHGEDIERVATCTLLGITFNDSLTWSDHVDKLYKRASSRLYFLIQLRRTKLTKDDIIKVYVALIRPLTEYACQLWHAGLTGQQIEQIESIQVRALATAYPDMSYEEALSAVDLPTLATRRDTLCKRLFVEAQETSHKLYNLMPKQRHITHNQRNAYKYPLPRVRTNRFKDTFINYCLFNHW